MERRNNECITLLQVVTPLLQDTYVNEDPTAEQPADITIMAADTIRRFGIGASSAGFRSCFVIW